MLNKDTKDLLDKWLPRGYAKVVATKRGCHPKHVMLVRGEHRQSPEVMLDLVRLAKRNRDKSKRIARMINAK